MKRRAQHSARYKAHLRSPEWAAIRKAALERARYRCAFCGQTQNELRRLGRHLEVHHSTYANLGDERPEDLTVLCAGRGGCHTAADRQRRAATGRGRRIRKPRLRLLRRAGRRMRVPAVLLLLLVLAPHVLPRLGSGVLAGSSCERPDHATRIYVSKGNYPNVVAHIKKSWREGYPHVLRINRDSADERRSRLLAWWQRRHPQPKGDGLDLDERPPAMLRRTVRASVWPIPASENRSEGARMRHVLDGVCDGQRVVYVLTP